MAAMNNLTRLGKLQGSYTRLKGKGNQLFQTSIVLESGPYAVDPAVVEILKKNKAVLSDVAAELVTIKTSPQRFRTNDGPYKEGAKKLRFADSRPDDSFAHHRGAAMNNHEP